MMLRTLLQIIFCVSVNIPLEQGLKLFLFWCGYRREVPRSQEIDAFYFLFCGI